MKSGLHSLYENPHKVGPLGRVGLVTSQSVAEYPFGSCVEMMDKILSCSSSSLVKIFGPQHGFYQTEQDNMRETPHLQIEVRGRYLPLISLYSHKREPEWSDLEDIDTLVVDLHDIGCRVYTYMWTLLGCMKQASLLGKKVVVLDRPNPLGLSVLRKKGWDRVEGHLLQDSLRSFVGLLPIPLRHGLTLGELGFYFKDILNLNLNYEVVRVEGLTREMKPLISHWSLPSPNMPGLHSALFFPSFVVFEGLNVSEGRGTTVPFQVFGAPWIHSQEFMSLYENICHQMKLKFPVMLRTHEFRPTFNKYQGEICRGFFCDVEPSLEFNSFEFGIIILACLWSLYPQKMKWLPPGYEYNFTHRPFELILGHRLWGEIFEKISSQKIDSCLFLLENAFEQARGECAIFAQNCEKYFLYR